MKQVAQNYRSGELAVLEVPAPGPAPGGVLVRSLYSLISTGTELMKVGESQLSLLGKARARPDQVSKVLAAARQQGVAATYHKAMDRLDSYTPLGYSLAGVVEEVGPGAEQFSVGDLVACAGADFALHAELNWVPVNLCVAVPTGVRASHAAFATVGAIALQGVRQAAAQLGETACVIGLGLVGQIVVQLLVASGVKVVGVDVVGTRCRLAESSGAEVACPADDASLLDQAITTASGGIGADVVVITAGGASNSPVETAVRVARDRGRIVDVGKCSLDLPWNAAYEKELDLRFSRSYGPGRYDPRYELEGVDYPIGYVRWTERRNLACVLDLIAGRRIDPDQLVADVFPVDEAPEVYRRLSDGELDGVAYLFSYPATASADHPTPQPPGVEGSSQSATVASPPVVSRMGHGTLRVGFIGAGNYASSMLLPHLANRDDVALTRVATRRALSAANAERKFGFSAWGTSASEVLSDPNVDAVFVVTRHSSHASLACQALEAGKAVFVEKPLCVHEEELDRILEVVERTGNDRIMVGFNRRFSPLLSEMRHRYGPPPGPTIARYNVNAGPLAPDSWYSMERTEGSRFVGEGGHFIDTLSWWMGADPVGLSAMATAGQKDLQVNLTYPDGSLGVVTYATGGHPRYPKETFDVSGGRRSARLDNFTAATVWSGHRRRRRRVLGSPDKGQKHEVAAFVESVRAGTAMPIPFISLVRTTRATLAVPVSLASGRPVAL